MVKDFTAFLKDQLYEKPQQAFIIEILSFMLLVLTVDMLVHFYKS